MTLPDLLALYAIDPDTIPVRGEPVPLREALERWAVERWGEAVDAVRDAYVKAANRAGAVDYGKKDSERR